MYGASVEKDFQHIKFENEQLQRRLETLRMLETEHEGQVTSRRSFGHIFGWLATRPVLRVPFGRSPLASS